MLSEVYGYTLSNEHKSHCHQTVVRLATYIPAHRHEGDDAMDKLWCGISLRVFKDGSHRVRGCGINGVQSSAEFCWSRCASTQIAITSVTFQW